jgi:transcriptional regulator with XRE-family HTH domain
MMKNSGSETDLELLAKKITECLKNDLRSQQQISEHAGISTRTIYQLKEAKREEPPLKSTAKLAIALNEDPLEWLEKAASKQNISKERCFEIAQKALQELIKESAKESSEWDRNMPDTYSAIIEHIQLRSERIDGESFTGSLEFANGVEVNFEFSWETVE